MSKKLEAAKKAPKPATHEQPKLKKIKTGLKGGGNVDPCNNCMAK